MRFLITWSSPVVVHSSGKHEAMGVYGVEGSKPGAAPVAAWLTHKTIGLDIEGYGTLFSEAIFTSSKVCVVS